jgi:hypothetical protein
MKPLAQVQWIAAFLLAGSAIAAGQSTLPPTAPTMREIQERPASVEYLDGRVAVLADNSSLSEIIRDVARRAGMAVKGDVVDERVFGSYGPAAPAEVLTALLKGTGSNMLVVAGSSRASELILTPKQGPPTPPVARVEDDAAEQSPEQSSEDAKKDTVDTLSTASTESDKAAMSADKVESDGAESAGKTAHPEAAVVDAQPVPALTDTTSATPQK